VAWLEASSARSTELTLKTLQRGLQRERELTLKTLQRGLQRERVESSDIQTDGKRVVRIKLVGRSGTADSERPFGMAVVLAEGRHILLP
jgi:hypothetical protein